MMQHGCEQRFGGRSDGPLTACLQQREELDLLASLEGLFLDDELSEHQRGGYRELLRQSELKNYRTTRRGLVLYFKNGRRIQFRKEFLSQIIELLGQPEADTKATLNVAFLRCLCRTLYGSLS